jgi:mannitol-1-phosphate/altronate dehydrogenase
MDRLSKPTAASQARMAAAAPATPVRGTAATSRTTTMKPKATTAASPKNPTKKEAVLPPAATTAAVVGVVASAIETFGQNSNVGDKSETVDPAESELQEAATEAQSQSQFESEQKLQEISTDLMEEETGSGGSADNEATATSSAPAFESTELGITEVPASDEKEPTAVHDTKDDLEDIVNLLESVSIAKPSNDVIIIPDEILEIPDEDDK